MANISIGGRLSLLQRVASLDLRYGPYSSIADAYDNMGPSGDEVITAGLPFGVTEDDGSVSVYIWTKGEDATQTDCRKLDKEHIVLFNGFIDISVSIKQQRYNDVATKDNIVFLNDGKQFAYRDGLNFYINWKNRYVWSNESLIPYDDVIYININDNKAYYYNGTTLTLLASETFVSSINNQAPDENGNVNLTKEHIGLEKVDNTSDTEKVVKGANEDGSGNNIATTYETKSDATTKNTALQNAISALQTSVENLTGLDSTNFGGFSIESTESDAISNIATIYTADGYTNELLWYMAGTSLSSVKAYRYNGSGTPTLISNDSYDCVDFSGLIAQLADTQANVNNIFTPTVIDLSLYSEVMGGLSGTTTWFEAVVEGDGGHRKGKFIDVTAGETYKIRCSRSANYAFMTSNATPIPGGTMPLVSGETRKGVTPDTDTYIVPPTGTKYIYIQTDYLNGNTYRWSIVHIYRRLVDVTDTYPKEDSSNPISSGAIYTLKDQILKPSQIDLTVYDEVMGGLSNTTNWFEAVVEGDGGHRKGKFVKVDAEKTYRLLCSNSANYAFMTSNATPVPGGTMPLVEGESRRRVSPNTNTDVITPVGTEYIYIQTDYLNGNTYDWSIFYVPEDINSAVDITLSNNKVDFSSYESKVGGIGAVNWQDNDRISKFVECKNTIAFKITAINGNVVVAFLKDNVLVKNQPINFASNTGRVSVLKGSTQVLRRPSDAVYICVQTWLETIGDVTPIMYRLNDSIASDLQNKAMLGQSIMLNAIIMSDEKWKYAFTVNSANLKDNNICAIYDVNEDITGDATEISNSKVLSSYNIRNKAITNIEFTAPKYFVDSTGNTISGYSRAYNSVQAIVGNNFRALTIIGNASSSTYSFGWRDYDNTPIGNSGDVIADTVKRCTLFYNSNNVEFTIENYRQMLYNLGFTSSVVQNTFPTQDNTCIFKYNSKFYIVLCGYHIKAENVPMPLILLESSNMKIWTYKCRIGTQTHYASEISSLMLNGILYVIYRGQITNSSVENGNSYYELIAYDISGNNIVFEKRIHSFIMSLPSVFEYNEDVYFAFNVKPSIYGNLNSYAYPNGRQQIDIYKVVSNDIEYYMSLENVLGINYFAFANKKTFTNNGDYVKYLDRLFIIYSCDSRYINYRQIGEVAVTELTSIFI